MSSCWSHVSVSRPRHARALDVVFLSIACRVLRARRNGSLLTLSLFPVASDRVPPTGPCQTPVRCSPPRSRSCAHSLTSHASRHVAGQAGSAAGSRLSRGAGRSLRQHCRSALVCSDCVLLSDTSLCAIVCAVSVVRGSFCWYNDNPFPKLGVNGEPPTSKLEMVGQVIGINIDIDHDPHTHDLRWFPTGPLASCGAAAMHVVPPGVVPTYVANTDMIEALQHARMCSNQPPVAAADQVGFQQNFILTPLMQIFSIYGLPSSAVQSRGASEAYRRALLECVCAQASAPTECGRRGSRGLDTPLM